MRNVIVTDVPRASLALADELARHGVATVHEAIGRTGYLGPRIRPVQDGARMSGTAVTVVCWPGDNLMVHAAIEQCGAGDVLIITTTSSSADGMFGELLATSAAARGVRGLVTTTGVRDVAVLRAMGFPVWSAAVSAQGTVKQIPGAVNIPVAVDGVLIRPGDAIIADDDGVVCVPRGDVPAALDEATTRTAKEAATRAELAAGTLGLDLYDLRPMLSGVEYVRYAEP
jgi:4-hydroxy-4-methyl-2-oxoglutarate aldolase